jgi:hypothetical protein
MVSPSAKNKIKENKNWGNYYYFTVCILIILLNLLLKFFANAFEIIIFNGKWKEYYIIVCPI